MMWDWFDIWLAFAALTGLTWIAWYRATLRVAARREVLHAGSHPGSVTDPPMVSVLVAAKDEEADIEACVTTLLDQDYPDFGLIVVDDRSEDRTLPILRRLEASAGGRLRVLSVTELRDGWFGKNNAMREAVAASRGEWLLLTDADCRQTSRRTITIAMRDAMVHEADFLSITPALDAHAAWERIIQPVCTMSLMMWFQPHRVNKTKRKTAYANGAFMLLRRSCYEAIGGHERFRTAVNEDIAMARATKAMGLRLRVAETDDLYRTRMYDSLGAAWHGWSRILYGSLSTLRRLFVTAGVLIFLAMAPWGCLAVAVVGCALADVDSLGAWTTAAWAWFVVVALEQVTMWRTYRLLGAGQFWSLTYAGGAAVTLGIVVNAMLKVLGTTGTTWRGTTYRGERLAEPAPGHAEGVSESTA